MDKKCKELAAEELKKVTGGTDDNSNSSNNIPVIKIEGVISKEKLTYFE